MNRDGMRQPNLSEREDLIVDIPADLWHTESFQRWYRAQISAGNTLEGARLAWSLRFDENAQELFLWALHVAVRVAAEGRVKANEVVISRPDVCAVALYRPAVDLDETVVVLVREFRSAASSPDGFVHELPSGSGAQSSARDQAAAELTEETGLVIAPSRLREHRSRQAVATLSAHHVHLFSVIITDEELAWLRAQSNQSHGNGGGNGEERTWIEIATFGEIRRNQFVDWTTLGLLAQVFLDSGDEAECNFAPR